MASQGCEKKIIPPLFEDHKMVCNKSSKNMAFTNTTFPNAHRYVTRPSQAPPSYSFDGGSNASYMGIDEFFNHFRKDDYEERRKFGAIKRQGMFSAAADPHAEKLKILEKIKPKEMFYKRTTDNKMPSRSRSPHYSVEYSNENVSDKQDKQNMPPLLPSCSSENVTTLKVFSNHSRIVTAGPPPLIPWIVVTTWTTDNRIITTAPTSPTPFLIVSVKSGSKTNQTDAEKNKVATRLPQQPVRRTINKVSRPKEAMEISDDRPNENVVFERSQSESNSATHLYNNSSSYDYDDEDVDILGYGGDDDDAEGVEDKLPPQPPAEAIDDDDGNISDNTYCYEIYNSNVDGRVIGSKPSNKTPAEVLLSHRSSTVVNSETEDRMKNAEIQTSDHPPIKKRGGGKVGRRRKRGYIYDPKPLVRKTKKKLLPSSQKDEDYWHRRQRNNEAAKRSRENRRVKELETMNLVKQLTDSNDELRKKIKHLELRNSYLERRDSISDTPTVVGTNSGHTPCGD